MGKRNQWISKDTVKLNVDANQILDCMVVKEEDYVSKGQVIAQNKGIFGLFKSQLKSPIDGTLVNISKITGQVILSEPPQPIQIDAYISGKRFIDFDDELLVCPSTVCDTGSPIDQVNLIAYLGGQHCYMFDKVNLVNILKRNGFSEVELREFEEGLDLKERDHESIYALAIK